MYLPAYAVTPVVKHSQEGQASDWLADPLLDARTKHLAESQILGDN